MRLLRVQHDLYCLLYTLVFLESELSEVEVNGNNSSVVKFPTAVSVTGNLSTALEVELGSMIRRMTQLYMFGLLILKT